jgi:hypothetical protein
MKIEEDVLPFPVPTSLKKGVNVEEVFSSSFSFSGFIFIAWRRIGCGVKG